MNKKGFTIAETLVTFVLVAFIGLTLLQLLLNYKDIASVRIKQQTYAAIKDQITAKIQKDARDYELLYIVQDSPNTITFVFNNPPSQKRLVVHNYNVSPSADPEQKYRDLNDKYIEYDGYKYQIPSGLPEYNPSDGISDYSTYQGVTINMGSIYYESSPINTIDDQFKTVYHVKVDIGVTDLDEDYGLDMVFVVNGKGTNSKFRNLVRDSSFESPDFTIAPNPNAGNYSDIGASTCVPTGGGGNYPELTNTEYVISSFHANNNLSCRCPKATAAEVTRQCSFELTQMVPVDGGKTYTLSYYYVTNYGNNLSYANGNPLGLDQICCKDGTCRQCTPVGTPPVIETAPGKGKEWNRLVYTFTVPSDCNRVKLKFGTISNTTNASRIAIDAIQLEESLAVSDYLPTS